MIANWAAAAHEIFLGVRDTTNLKGKELLGVKGITVLATKTAVAAAASFGDTIGKVIIDAMTIVAGDSAKGKEIACKLVFDPGFAECYDVRGNDKFELMEQFAFFWINLAIMQGFGRDIGFKLLQR